MTPATSPTSQPLPSFLAHFLFPSCTARPIGHVTYSDQPQTSRPFGNRGIVVNTWLPTLEKSGRVAPYKVSSVPAVVGLY